MTSIQDCESFRLHGFFRMGSCRRNDVCAIELAGWRRHGSAAA